MSEQDSELASFMRGEFDPKAFQHRDHVRVGFEMLRRHSFVEVALHYSQALQVMSEKAGKPHAFHQTVTLAFLSLISERMETGELTDFETFERTNTDLIDKSVLSRWYRSERLELDVARRTFVLPEPAR
ncbi:MAG TPA: hypothetical protein VHN17_01905 [Steroidobacteraceae bacterium]|nr:hypothetical protein [Steroidobacteraceae bacterium]